MAEYCSEVRTLAGFLFSWRMTMTTASLKTALRNGKYAWPGGYPIYFITSDGEPLSFDTVKENYREVLYAMKYFQNFSGWYVVAYEVNWEDDNLFCAHSGEKIESAYGE
jgi:hypothetical protein